MSKCEQFIIVALTPKWHAFPGLTSLTSALTLWFCRLDMTLTEVTANQPDPSSPVCVWSEQFLLPPPLQLVH